MGRRAPMNTCRDVVLPLTWLVCDVAQVAFRPCCGRLYKVPMMLQWCATLAAVLQPQQHKAHSWGSWARRGWEGVPAVMAHSRKVRLRRPAACTRQNRKPPPSTATAEPAEKVAATCGWCRRLACAVIVEHLGGPQQYTAQQHPQAATAGAWSAQQRTMFVLVFT
jgi:hypothetical protein